MAAAVVAVGLCGLSVAVWGLDPWFGFFADSDMARDVLDQGGVGHYKMQSLFAAVRLFGGGLAAAYGAQGLLAVCVAATLAWACRRSPDAGTIGAALAIGALLASPFLLVYDLVLLAIPLLWVWQSACRTGFLPWEKAILAMAFFMPMISSSTAKWLHIPMAPVTLLAVFAPVVRRISLKPIGSR